MNRKEITKKLSKMTEKHIDPTHDARVYWAREVTFGYGKLHPIRVDYMQFKPKNNSVSGIEKGDFCCYEIKSSVEDFNSKHGHNFIGDYNYYVMPRDIYETIKSKIPYGVGVYCPCGNELRSVRMAKRIDRTRPITEMLLMMFRSAARDSLIVGRR